MKWISLLTAWASFLVAAEGAGSLPHQVPGPQPDGSMLLHNQWPIRPVGAQIPLGDFPVNLAVDPAGRYAAVLHAGYGPHEIWIVDLLAGAVTAVARVDDTFEGLAFSGDGSRLVASGGSDAVLHVFGFDRGRLGPQPNIPLPDHDSRAVVGGIALAPDGRTVFATVLFTSKIVRASLAAGTVDWMVALDSPEETAVQPENRNRGAAPDPPNDVPWPQRLVEESDPLALAVDWRRRRVYASLWGKSNVAVLDADNGKVLALWAAGLHPNELLLSRDGRRLFVSNGGRNSVTELDTETGLIAETLTSSLAPSDPPGSTPDSLCLSPDGRTLFVANGYNNNVAVFDVANPGKGRALGFIPTGWFPTRVRATPDGRRLLVISARGLTAKPNLPLSAGAAASVPEDQLKSIIPGPGIPEAKFSYIGALYHGSLGIVDLPKNLESGDSRLRQWTAIAEQCRPVFTPAAEPGNPIPARRGPGGAGASPLHYVIYVVKENRTYDQVLGDMPEGNGDPSLCLFPEKTTPNLHRLARQFVLLDNFYANAEISASGHEWSMAAYSSEFVEKTWPPNYGHKRGNVPYPAEGRYAAAVPAAGYLWDRAQAAGITYRDYGEFAAGEATTQNPSRSNLPALQGHIDPLYRGWKLTFSDLDRVPRFIAELHRFESAGEMPRLQIVRLGNDHTEAARAGALTPRAMVAQNDLALGRLVEAVSRSRFWPQTAIFVVEDDAQNGPDHVDAHRTEALAISPYVRHGAVDSTAYTTCSMLATIELILGLEPMSQFDASAAPMRASFQASANLDPYTAAPAQVSLSERNLPGTLAARLSAKFDFSREDANDDQLFNRAIWAAVRGPDSRMPAPVHAAFVRPLPASDDAGDDD